MNQCWLGVQYDECNDVVSCSSFMQSVILRRCCFFVVMYAWQLFMIVDYEYVEVNAWWWICRGDLLIDQYLMYGCIVW
jgi:hypothetical protein